MVTPLKIYTFFISFVLSAVLLPFSGAVYAQDNTTTVSSDSYLCTFFPNILACATPELDTPASDVLPTKSVDVVITPVPGFGGGGGGCPSGATLRLGGIQLSYKPVCDFMVGARPIVLAAAWLAAGLILLGL